MAYKFDKSGKLLSVTVEELENSGDDGSFVIILDYSEGTNGKAYWLYIAVKAYKYREFRRLVAQRATVELKDYGKILRFGYEREVPDAIKQAMAKKYGYDDAYLQWLKNDAEQERQSFLKEKEEHENERINDIVAMLKKQQQ